MAEAVFPREMARRGFVAAAVEYPGMRLPQNRSGDVPPNEPTAAARAARELAMSCDSGDASRATSSLIAVAARQSLPMVVVADDS